MKAVLILSFALVCLIPAFGQVGQEYGKAGLPPFITHLTKRSSELRTARGHWILQRILCFSIPCRKEYARRKRISGISFEEFTRRVKRNAKKGAYKTTPRDTTRTIIKPKERIAKTEPVTITEASMTLKQDSVIILGGEVLFETDSYTLKDQHLPTLDSLITFLKRQPALEAIVSGHTDNVGKESYNHQLSARRAEVVAKYLSDRGVPDENVSSEGFGSQRPIADNSSEAGRARNRRVEILVHRK